MEIHAKAVKMERHDKYSSRPNEEQKQVVQELADESAFEQISEFQAKISSENDNTDHPDCIKSLHLAVERNLLIIIFFILSIRDSSSDRY